MLGIQIYYKVRCFMNGILFLNALNTYRKDASSRPLIIKFPHHKILGCTTNRDVLLLSTLFSISTLSAKYHTVVNPKRCGLFGQLRRRGGIKVSHFRIMVSGGLNFHSSYTNSTSYESWHIQLNFETLVRSLRLIVWPQEVTEVTEVKMKKNRRKL